MERANNEHVNLHGSAVDASVSHTSMDTHGEQIAAANELMMASALEKYDAEASGGHMEMNSSGLRRKRSDLEGGEDYEEEDEDDNQSEYNKDEQGKDERVGRASTKRARRHHWQPKYELEFGLIPMERNAVSGDVTLAICGFCKAFGREGKYEQLIQPEPTNESGETKKRRRRSLTTTKFFRAFRVDNIRSHLQGAHPRRWAEYETLPKQENVRARYFQIQGEFHYDSIPMVDDVLGASTLGTDSDIAYAHAQAQALGHHHSVASVSSEQVTSTVSSAPADSSGLEDTMPATQPPSVSQRGPGASTNAIATTNSTSQLSAASSYGMVKESSDIVEEPEHLRKRNNRLVAAGSRTTFDYERHLVEQLALDRERLEFEKQKFQKEVELRERELAQREKMMEQDRQLRDKEQQAYLEKMRVDNAKFLRLTEVLRDAVLHANGSVDVSSGSVV